MNNRLRIIFHTPQIDVRGTSTAVYDYALYNEKLLENKSFIVYDNRNKKKCDLKAILKFRRRFQVFSYSSREELYNFLISKKCDIFYTIKYGVKDDIIFPDIKTVVHCVFDLSQPHGDVYAAVSETLAKKYGKNLFVPHMINLPFQSKEEDMREELGIPRECIVFGRHGGFDTFDLTFCRDIISEVANKYNIYFLFMNTPKFVDNHKVIFLDPIADMGEKLRFIQTCDAYLECGSLGHTMGLSMGEFSVKNKPIIAYKGPVWNTAHYDILKDKAFYFHDRTEFKKILTTFQKIKGVDLNCYKKFSPNRVMEIFEKIFLK